MTNEMVLLNYASTGDSGFGGMFALAGGFKATITARLAGVDLEVRGFPLGEGKRFEWGLELRALDDDEVPSARYTYKKSPAFVRATGGYGTIPALLSRDGSRGVCESNAIARVIARINPRAGLYGDDAFAAGQIDMFLDKCLVFERDRGDWIDAVLFGEALGFTLSDDALAAHQAGAAKWLSAVDAHLQGRAFLVGEGCTVADVVLACQMLVPWHCLLDEDRDQRWPALARHLKKLYALEAFAVDLSEAVRALTDEYAARRGEDELA